MLMLVEFVVMVEEEVVVVLMIMAMVMMVKIHLQSFILQQSQQLLVDQLGFGAQELGHLMEERVVWDRGSYNICIFLLRANLVRRCSNLVETGGGAASYADLRVAAQTGKRWVEF